MKYMGSKNRHAKEILEIVLKNRKDGQFYVEPFVGGFNLIDKVSGNRIANDKHFYLIELFKAIQNGWIPPDNVSEEEYKSARLNKSLNEPFLTGFIGFGCSFSGKWFGGYARGNQTNGNPRNYCLESKKNIIKQAEKIKGVSIFNVDYWELQIPENSIVYCDPPYENTQKYSNEFDHKKFWAWCDKMVELGNTVFVSEYNAPENWKCVWSKKVNNTLDLNTGSKQGIEKLFTLKNE